MTFTVNQILNFFQYNTRDIRKTAFLVHFKHPGAWWPPGTSTIPGMFLETFYVEEAIFFAVSIICIIKFYRTKVK